MPYRTAASAKSSTPIIMSWAGPTASPFMIGTSEDTAMMNQPLPPAKTHSKLGIASFVIALATFVLVTTVTIYMGLLSGSRTKLQETVLAGWVVIFFIVAPLAHLVGIALAIIAFFRKD